MTSDLTVSYVRAESQPNLLISEQLNKSVYISLSPAFCIYFDESGVNNFDQKLFKKFKSLTMQQYSILSWLGFSERIKPRCPKIFTEYAKLSYSLMQLEWCILERSEKIVTQIISLSSVVQVKSPENWKVKIPSHLITLSVVTNYQLDV